MAAAGRTGEEVSSVSPCTMYMYIVNASQVLSFAVFSVAEQAVAKERLEEDVRRLQAELNRK